jgi:hypothetical protein
LEFVKILQPSEVVISLQNAIRTQLPKLFDVLKVKVMLMKVKVAAISLLSSEFFVAILYNLVHDFVEHVF